MAGQSNDACIRCLTREVEVHRRRGPARCDQAREEDIAQALVAPSREVYTTASCLSKMPTCTMAYTQDSHANPNEQLKTKLPPVPDLDNRRYCRACECTLPLAAFPSGTRRFLCKRHIWERVQQPSKRRALANNKHKKQLWTMWKKCWTDALLKIGIKNIKVAKNQHQGASACIFDFG